jgi:hypothetical protein
LNNNPAYTVDDSNLLRALQTVSQVKSSAELEMIKFTIGNRDAFTEIDGIPGNI